MLAVLSNYRKKGIAENLVTIVVNQMALKGCTQVVLETEANNVGSLALYQKLGFFRDKKLARYYLNGVDAYRLKICL
jgi:peptide alpha-N-acetyltransferase